MRVSLHALAGSQVIFRVADRRAGGEEDESMYFISCYPPRLLTVFRLRLLLF